jgi:hypothetical protein
MSDKSNDIEHLKGLVSKVSPAAEPPAQARSATERACRNTTNPQLQAKITELEGKAGSAVKSAVDGIVGGKPSPKLVLMGPPGAGKLRSSEGSGRAVGAGVRGGQGLGFARQQTARYVELFAEWSELGARPATSSLRVQRAP